MDSVQLFYHQTIEETSSEANCKAWSGYISLFRISKSEGSACNYILFKRDSNLSFTSSSPAGCMNSTRLFYRHNPVFRASLQGFPRVWKFRFIVASGPRERPMSYITALWTGSWSPLLSVIVKALFQHSAEVDILLEETKVSFRLYVVFQLPVVTWARIEKIIVVSFYLTQIPFVYVCWPII